MKLHPVLVSAVVNTVITIFAEGQYADKAIHYMLKSNSKWGSRDRAFIAEHTYEIVRWWRQLHFINNSRMDDLNRETIMHLLAILIYKKTGEVIPPFPNKINIEWDNAIALASNERKIRASIPDWLDELGVEELGEKWDSMITAMNDEAQVALRVNTLRTNKQELRDLLEKEGIQTEEIREVPQALFLSKRSNIFKSPYFIKGYFEVQDPGSQMIASYLGVEPGMRVIDACAGAGGKTLHLSAEMRSKGTIIALDLYDNKLQELKRRAKRNGAGNIETRVITSTKVIKRLHDSADRILLDVPCSGLGVLRRNPDAKWKLEPAFIRSIRDTQAQILQSYSRMLKPGGRMVYATCSILPSENEMQVKHFLDKTPDFTLVKQQNTSPDQEGFDGFYMALLERKIN